MPDNTLGAESSVVTPNVNINGIPSDRIDGGAPRGANLFHSFSQFNIGEGRGAYFTNPPEIENILSRVTGANRSDILGRLGVLGDANLFLINPNGIVFGQNASLDVQGSFLATTADAVKLGDAGLFSASQPATSNLLTVNPSALWFNAVAAQPIVNRSQAQSLIGQPNSNDGSPGLQVQTGRTLALVGGDVLLEGGNLTAAQGRIELGSVTGVGEVSLDPSGNGFVLGYDLINDFGNISLSNEAFVDASGLKSGDVQIWGARLEMTEESFISADTLGAQNGGEVLVRTTEEVVLSEGSFLTANVFGTGTGGDLTIDTGQLLISDGAGVSTITANEGAAGNLTALASDRVEVTGTNDRSRSGLGSESQGKGDAGDLIIETGQLLISDGAVVTTTAVDEGAGGNLTVLASDRVEVTGTNDDGFPSFLGSQSLGTGDAGNLTIDTGQLLVSDGAGVSTEAFDEGAGGNLTVLASDRVEVTGTNDRFRSFLGSISRDKGDAGEVAIDTGQLLISDGALVSTGAFNEGAGGNLIVLASDWVEVTGTNGRFPSALSSESGGKGDAGEVTIDTGQLLVSDGAVVSTTAVNEGAGGNLTVLASARVEVRSFSGLGSQSLGTGNAGEVTIDTGQLLISDGAQVSTTAFNEGTGGNLTVLASDRVEVTGTNGRFPSALGSGSDDKGDAGEVRIETGQLLVSDGAVVSTTAVDEGAGGKLTVLASDRVEVTGTNDGFDSFLGSESEGKGDAGEVRIETGQILVSNGARVSTTAFNEGAGGNLTVVSDSVALNNQGSLNAASEGTGNTGNITITVDGLLSATDSDINTSSLQSAGGAITIKAENIRLFGDSDITTSVSSGAGGGGNINLTANSVIALDDSDILAFASGGRGGDITLDTKAFFGENYSPAPRNTIPSTFDGNNRVDVNATGAVEGVITRPDTTFIQNSLTELPENQIDTDSLLANSCIVRRNQPTQGSFTITGTGGLPQRPGDAQMSTFPTVDIETLPSDGTPTNTNPNRPWQKGDPIVEPQGVYRLPNGKLVLSRECS
jgi:filamentous hemagglutinin family protein